MTITKKYLRDWEKSTFITITPEQKRIILERFGTEPAPYEWSDQDIAVQISNYLGCGEFVKSIRDNSGAGKRYRLPDDIPF